MDTPTHGMDMAPISQFPRRTAPLPAGLPEVRVEVRNGSARPTTYDVPGEEFLIGSVPGCDLRLPGTNLPPVICLIARQTDGVRLRRLTPTLPVLVNGQPITHTTPTNLTHGDCISIGAVDIQVAIDLIYGDVPRPIAFTNEPRPPEWNLKEKELQERERALEAQTRELEADRILWYRRRDEIEQEVQQARQSATTYDRHGDDQAARDARLRFREDELNRRQAEIKRQEEDLGRLRDESVSERRSLGDRFTSQREDLTKTQESIRISLDAVRRREEGLEAEFAARRQALEDDLKQRREQAEAQLRQWHDRGASGLTNLHDQVEREVAAKHRQRAEELDRFQMSLREAAVQLRERKQELDAELERFEPNQRELAEREQALARTQEQLAQRESELQREREILQIERQTAAEPLTQKEKDLALRESEIAYHHQQLEIDRDAIETLKKQYEADLIRLDRWQVTLDEKERQLQSRATLVDQRLGSFQTDTRDLEDQVKQIDAREEQIRAEEQRQARQREEIDQREAKLNERLAQAEGQQAMLAALRTRLEHTREEQRLEAARIAEERSRLLEQSAESRERLLDAERLRDQMSNEQAGQSETERVFRERSEILQQAVQRMRELQTQLSDEDERLRKQAEEMEAFGSQLAEREGVLTARTEQLLEQQQRLEADRAAMKQREENLFLTEGTRESLQDQLRRRADELITRGQELDNRAAQLQAEAEKLTAQRDALQAQLAEAAGKLSVNEEQSNELARRDAELREQGETLRAAEQALVEARAFWETSQTEANEKAAQARKDIDELKQALARQASELFTQVPDFEARAHSALERTTQAREALRGQLSELHGYAKQSQDDLERVRVQVQTEIERMTLQESTLNRSRVEHRHAVASFRQQLLEWQSRFADMKQVLSQGESRIDRRAKDIEATSQQLARQAVEIETKEREVGERHVEMSRHLNDMREWYRKKLREIVESRNAERAARDAESAEVLPMLPVGEVVAHEAGQDEPPLVEVESGVEEGTILTFHDDLDPADRNLGDMLRSLELVDAETLNALWSEARRQHRPLRQVLLAGNYLTLYQLALMETGNLSGLVLGRFRVIDRLQSSPREAVYRVFDPQSREGENADRGLCLLRHLGEAEMPDAVHPDEYRQRFSAARDIAHPNLLATREVLEINGRPAVVQEWLRGLPGSEFPENVGVPGVWYRLLSQAALGLHTAHQAGLMHGRLIDNSLLLTRAGVLKIAGLGEPPWLHGNKSIDEPSAESDLRDLGRVVVTWTQNAPKRRGKKGLPESLQAVLRGLGADSGESVPAALYPNTAALLEDLDRAGRDVPADVATWEKLLEHVSENTAEGPLLRQSA